MSNSFSLGNKNSHVNISSDFKIKINHLDFWQPTPYFSCNIKSI